MMSTLGDIYKGRGARKLLETMKVCQMLEHERRTTRDVRRMQDLMDKLTAEDSDEAEEDCGGLAEVNRKESDEGWRPELDRLSDKCLKMIVDHCLEPLLPKEWLSAWDIHDVRMRNGKRWRTVIRLASACKRFRGLIYGYPDVWREFGYIQGDQVVRYLSQYLPVDFKKTVGGETQNLEDCYVLKNLAQRLYSDSFSLFIRGIREHVTHLTLDQWLPRDCELPVMSRVSTLTLAGVAVTCLTAPSPPYPEQSHMSAGGTTYHPAQDPDPLQEPEPADSGTLGEVRKMIRFIEAESLSSLSGSMDNDSVPDFPPDLVPIFVPGSANLSVDVRSTTSSPPHASLFAKGPPRLASNPTRKIHTALSRRLPSVRILDIRKTKETCGQLRLSALHEEWPDIEFLNVVVSQTTPSADVLEGLGRWESLETLRVGWRLENYATHADSQGHYYGTLAEDMGGGPNTGVIWSAAPGLAALVDSLRITASDCELERAGATKEVPACPNLRSLSLSGYTASRAVLAPLRSLSHLTNLTLKVDTESSYYDPSTVLTEDALKGFFRDSYMPLEALFLAFPRISLDLVRILADKFHGRLKHLSLTETRHQPPQSQSEQGASAGPPGNFAGQICRFSYLQTLGYHQEGSSMGCPCVRELLAHLDPGSLLHLGMVRVCFGGIRRDSESLSTFKEMFPRVILIRSSDRYGRFSDREIEEYLE